MKMFFKNNYIVGMSGPNGAGKTYISNYIDINSSLVFSKKPSLYPTICNSYKSLKIYMNKYFEESNINSLENYITDRSGLIDTLIYNELFINLGMIKKTDYNSFIKHTKAYISATIVYTRHAFAYTGGPL